MTHEIDPDRRLRIGVLGAGPIAQFGHLEGCRKARNAELYAICDAAEDLLARVAAAHPPRRTYTSYAAMLGDPGIDAVVVAIADQFHVAAALQAVAAGKHVLVEKPLGVTVEECEALARAVREAGVVLQVGTQRRYDPNIARAADFIRREMGEVLAMRAWYCDSSYRYTMTDAIQPMPITSPDAVRPAGDPKADRIRYSLLGHGSHLVDTAQFLCGPIASVRAQRVEKYGAYSWFIHVDFADGSQGHLDLTLAVRMDWHEGFHVYGEHGSVVARAFNPWYFRSADVECFSTKDGAYHRPLGADSQFFRRQIEGLAGTVLTGAPLQGAGVEDGLSAVRVLAAVSHSTATGETVAVEKFTGVV
jgi:predicted dehydrogenase